MSTLSATDTVDAYATWITSQTGLVVLQPTTLCNLDCPYCYLPFRKKRLEMPVEVPVHPLPSLDSSAMVGGFTA
jgi:uncharacterized protein